MRLSCDYRRREGRTASRHGVRGAWTASRSRNALPLHHSSATYTGSQLLLAALAEKKIYTDDKRLEVKRLQISTIRLD